LRARKKCNHSGDFASIAGSTEWDAESLCIPRVLVLLASHRRGNLAGSFMRQLFPAASDSKPVSRAWRARSGAIPPARGRLPGRFDGWAAKRTRLAATGGSFSRLCCKTFPG
jgi:hypothetical protein